MNFLKNTLVLLSVCLGLSSCILNENIKVMQVEVMKPGAFFFPENIENVAIFKRDLYHTDTCTFKYFNLDGIVTDTAFKISELSRESADALSGYFKKSAYFKNVRNFRDSLNAVLTTISSDELFHKTNSDMLVFLDYFKFNDLLINKSSNQVYTSVVLFWTIALKNDSSAYVYNQIDTLNYDDWEFKNYNLAKEGYKKILMDAAKYLGESFGKKIIPSWMPVERMYYTSNNADMLKAEQFALNNEWLKAAEIWNKETKNKNPRIVAKSCYNMALAAEMEGQIDLSIDWLIKSYSSLAKNNSDHQENCKRYINVLALRKKEIERLDRQVRN
jgi:hypothetical protein